MNLFQTPEASHQHSLQTLESIAAYDDFMENIRVVCDMGCGNGLDILWWANSTYRDDDDIPRSRNYDCYGKSKTKKCRF